MRRRRTPIAALALIIIAAGGTSAGTGSAAAADPTIDPAAAAADALVASDHLALHKSPDDVLVRTGSHTGSHGLRYFSYERAYRGLPVVGGDLVVVTDAAGAVLHTAVAQPEVISVATRPAVSAAAALATARGQLAAVQTAESPRLVVLAWPTPRLAWEVKLTGTAADRTPSVLSSYIDALTGDVAATIDLVRDGIGNGFYNGTVSIDTSGSGSSFAMSDPTRPGIRCGGQNGATFTGSDDNWGNGTGTSLETACVDALYAVQHEWEMLDDWLGRDGINGNGGGFPARVGWSAVNASWNGRNTNFGRSSDNQRQVTPMDVVAHEYGHAIFQTTPGGAGFGRENGGLNESTGDIFGALTEAFTDNPNDPPDFLVGEEVDLVGDGEIRNMFNPAAKGHPNCWSTDIPDTEVHAAAGPLNHWFYLVSEGSNPSGGPASPICAGGPSSVTGIGIQAAGQIFYHSLLAKTSTWRYANVRLASLVATVNMFGASSPECVTVKAAWDAVSVPAQSGEPTCGGGQPPGDEVFSDDFETATGWTTDGGGGDTATSGQWERGNPEPTSFNGIPLQLGDPVSGSNNLSTGRLVGGSVGANDIDNGVTTVRSPLIALPASGSLSLSFAWYLGHLNNSSSADFFRVAVVSGGSTTVIGTASGAGSNRAAAWSAATLSLDQFAGETVRIQFEAADLAGGSLVEAGVDDVLITTS